MNNNTYNWISIINWVLTVYQKLVNMQASFRLNTIRGLSRHHSTSRSRTNPMVVIEEEEENRGSAESDSECRIEVNSKLKANQMNQKSYETFLQSKLGDQRLLNSRSIDKDFTESKRDKKAAVFPNSSQEQRQVRVHRNQKSKLLTTGHRRSNKEYIVSVIEYKSNEVGVAIYNVNTGEIFLSQIIQRMTYLQTISTLHRFYPQEIVYSQTQQNSVLVKKLLKVFKNSVFRANRRQCFDETRGFKIYNERNNKQESNPDNKFIAYAALSALILYLQSFAELKINYKSLNIKWHHLDHVLVIDTQTILDLEIFLNGESKKVDKSFIQNFKCCTHGGNRMLRANLLQPLNDVPKINQRLDVVECLLRNIRMLEIIRAELLKYKLYEPITVKFMETIKQNDSKFIKTFIFYLLLIFNFVNSLLVFRDRLRELDTSNLKIFSDFQLLLEDRRITEIKAAIEMNFDESILKTFDNTNKSRKDNYIFLVKLEKIEDEFANVCRITYAHTVEDIINIYESIKSKTNINFKLNHNECRGYYLSCRGNVDLNVVSEKIKDDIIQISHKNNTTTFSTTVLVSMNNRLKENEKKIIFQSEKKIVQVIEEIQERLEILFQLNYTLSVIDMLTSFAEFVRFYGTTKFTRPIFQNNFDVMEIHNLSTLWTNQRFFKPSDKISLSMNEVRNILIIQKDNNSSKDLNLLTSIGYLVILSQIGCLVPVDHFKISPFRMLMSKFRITDNIENSLSHFQSEAVVLNNVLQTVYDCRQRSLILIDEIVKGTKYQQQLAISLGFLKCLTKLTGLAVILSSQQIIINSASSTFPQIKIKSKQNMQEHLDELLDELNFDSQFIYLCEIVPTNKKMQPITNLDHSKLYASRQQILFKILNLKNIERVDCQTFDSIVKYINY